LTVLKQLFDYVQRLLLLAHETKQNRDDLGELQERVESLTEKVQILASAIERIGERDWLEREKNLLQLENTVLRLERRLPPAKPPRDRN
jgi:chromosome segregation ATPase